MLQPTKQYLFQIKVLESISLTNPIDRALQEQESAVGKIRHNTTSAKNRDIFRLNAKNLVFTGVIAKISAVVSAWSDGDIGEFQA